MYKWNDVGRQNLHKHGLLAEEARVWLSLAIFLLSRLFLEHGVIERDSLSRDDLSSSLSTRRGFVKPLDNLNPPPPGFPGFLGYSVS